jgi:DNA (cytosine-5)-methyltransferase 1
VEQLNIFSYTLPQYKITKPIRLVEKFAGIGSQAKALKNLGVNFEHYRVVERDKYAVASYNAIHGTNFTTSDITKISGTDLGIVDTHLYDYILTYSFPCTDISLAGKMGGMSKGSNTRSGLLWEVERLLDECKELPQILLMENVPQIISQRNIADFQDWQYKLEQLGYSNYVSLLNAKDYGIPQNRNRCFMVSILGKYYYKFPHKQELKLRLKDMLEDEVDEKYYLSETAIQYMFNTNYQQNKFKTRVQGEIASTLCARDYKDPKCILVGNLFGGKWDNINESARRVYSEGGLAPTIHTCQGGNTEPKVAQKVAVAVAQRKRENGQEIETSNREYANAITTVQKDSMVLTCESLPKPFTMKDYLSGKYDWFVNKVGMLIEDCDDYDGSGNDVGVVVCEQRRDEGLRFFNDGCIGTLRTIDSGGDKRVIDGLRIRKLTPKECWRLMGFSDEDFEKASKANSNTQLYKQAGNSIVVNVLMAIFKELL